MNAVSGQSGLAHRFGRRARIAAIGTAAAITLTACAAGQHAQTAVDQPAIDGTGGKIGTMLLQDVFVQAPEITGRPTGDKYYASGDNAPMTLSIINDGHTADTLTAVSSPAFTGWSIVSTADAGDASAVKAGASTQVVAPNESVGLGLHDLGVAPGESADTLVLQGLTASQKTLFPGSSIPVTFTFATAGSVTLQVPVNLTATPPSAVIPPSPSDSGI